MNVYIARQPIFDKDKTLFGYELLYRKSEENRFSGDVDGTEATCAVLSDAITLFGLENLTNGKPALVKFTKDLMMDEFALFANPEDVIVEIFQDDDIDDGFVEKVGDLKKLGYTIALEGFNGEKKLDNLIEYVDVLKIDFLKLDRQKRNEITKKYIGTEKKLLAEKVEMHDDFVEAVEDGYSLFQGYFFEKPKMFSKKSTNIGKSSYIRVICELNKDDMDINEVAKIVNQDIGLTYKLFQKMNTVAYYRGGGTTSTSVALSKLGLDEIRRWILLMMAKDFNKGKSDEIIKMALIRARFAEKIAKETALADRYYEAFMMGMFSLLDLIVEADMTELLNEIPLADEVKAAILGEQNEFGEILEFVKAYEDGQWEKICDNKSSFSLDVNTATNYYFECLMYADEIFMNV